MADKKISALTAITQANLASDDLFPVVDTSAVETKSITVAEMDARYIQSTGVTDHGALTGLTDDDHSNYALLAGRSGGQALVGGTGASESLTLSTTANATKGTVEIANTVSVAETTKEVTITGSEAAGATKPLIIKDSGAVEVFSVDSDGDVAFNTITSATTGSASAPTIMFNGQTNSGIYSTGGSNIQISGGGTELIIFNSSGINPKADILHQSSTAADPKYTFASQTDAGLYRDSSSNIGMAYGGAAKQLWTAAGITVNGDTADGSTKPLVINDSGAAEVFHVNSDGDVDGTDFTGSNFTATARITVSASSASAPSLRFSSDTNTGIYSAGSDLLGLAAGGVQYGEIASTCKFGNVGSATTTDIGSDGVLDEIRPYGAMYEDATGSPTTINLTSAGTYYQWVNTTDGGTGSYVTHSGANDNLTVASGGEGTWEITYDVSFTGSNSQTITAGIYINGVLDVKSLGVRGLGVGPAVGSFGRTFITTISAADTIDLRFKSSASSASVDIHHISLTAKRISK